MQRNPPPSERDPRRTAERDASQAIGGQDRSAEEDADVEKPDNVPSFLTARELQARKPSKGSGERASGERHGSASFTGSRGEPPITDEQPARGKRGVPPGGTPDEGGT